MDEDNQNNAQVEAKSNTWKIVGVVVALIILAIGAFLFLGKNDDKDDAKNSVSGQNNSSQRTSSNSSTNDSQNSAKTFTTDQVAQHKTKDDCWTIIGDKVYDITSYVPRHPGGNEILRACGTDGTSLFETRTTADGQKVGTGTPHSSSSQNQLKQLEIGAISN